MKCCICGSVRKCEPFLDKVLENLFLINSLQSFTPFLIS